MHVPGFGEERYTIQKIKKAWLGATTVNGKQRGGGGVMGRCGLRLYKRCEATQNNIYVAPKY